LKEGCAVEVGAAGWHAGERWFMKSTMGNR